MKNLVGPASFGRWAELAAIPDVALHLYGKAELRDGRKMGHATRLLPAGTLAHSIDPAALAPI